MRIDAQKRGKMRKNRQKTALLAQVAAKDNSKRINLDSILSKTGGQIYSQRHPPSKRFLKIVSSR
jgi:hypothetical protein